MSIEAAAQRDDVHYSSSAYHPARIPNQPASAKRGWLKRFGNSRLPWGQTQDIVPVGMLSGTTPADLRAIGQYEEELASATNATACRCQQLQRLQSRRTPPPAWIATAKSMPTTT
jgi:hypothetical protein